MSDAFQARLEILPEVQRRLWPELRPTVQLGFVLMLVPDPIANAAKGT
jgi:hypothetical protein